MRNEHSFQIIEKRHLKKKGKIWNKFGYSQDCRGTNNSKNFRASHSISLQCKGTKITVKTWISREPNKMVHIPITILLSLSTISIQSSHHLTFSCIQNLTNNWSLEIGSNHQAIDSISKKDNLTLDDQLANRIWCSCISSIRKYWNPGSQPLLYIRTKLVTSFFCENLWKANYGQTLWPHPPLWVLVTAFLPSLDPDHSFL